MLPKKNQTVMPAAPDVREAALTIAHSPFFKRKWYIDNTAGMKGSGLDPAYHYLWVGAGIGCNPGPHFDTEGYLAAYPQVAKAGINPLVHFEKVGRRQGLQVPQPQAARSEPRQAITASTVTARDWSMTKAEASQVILGLLVPPDTVKAPQRLMSRFDVMAARRYVTAAAVLYDAECERIKATVILPTYNRGAQLDLAIDSVLAQSHRNFELLVVDDGSMDNTRERLARFDDDPRVRVFWNDHGGVSAARNTGLANATGDVVFYLDSDNTWTPDYVKSMLVGLQVSGADCAYAASCIVTTTGKLVGYRGEPFDWAACLSGNYVDMNVFVHRTWLARALGDFDTSLRRVVDWDLILRYSRDHAPAFFPFVGCLYLDDREDQTRISVSQFGIYRKIVVEKHERNLASGVAAVETMSLSIGIKIAAPYDRRDAWGDFHYAESLVEALGRLGHSARIDFLGDWNTPQAKGDDVALVLRGLSPYTPQPGQLTLMWNISHPDQVSYAEYAGCNGIFVTSRSYAALLSIVLDRPVHPLLQCTDTSRFGSDAMTMPPDETARGLFVGNSRREYRDMVRWSVENDIDIDIYGEGWASLIPEERIAGKNVPNRMLGRKYGAARFVLNDHWQSMKDFGFVSNRVFDVVASGGRLISDNIPAIGAIFGDVVETVDDAAGLVAAIGAEPPAAARRQAAADYVRQHHSFDARAWTLQAAVRHAILPHAPAPEPAPDFETRPVRRRSVGLLLQRGRAWWTSSAYIRLIGPLTSDHAHAAAGLDLVILDGPDDPRLDTCDICIVQRIAVSDPDAARRLIAVLHTHNIPLYVDTDDAFFLHDDHRAADGALRLLMAASRETWFSTHGLANLYDGVAPASRVIPNNLDPRFWRDYRKPVRTEFDHDTVRFVYMGTATHHGDLQMVMPAFERLAQTHAGQFELTLMGVTSTPPMADWLKLRNPPRDMGSYPAFARFATRDTSFDVGIAPLMLTAFNAAKSDIKFLDYSAMGVLSVVSDGPVYRDCIDAGLAIGCGPTTDDWYDTLAGIVTRPADFAAIRERAAEHLWTARNALEVPEPLADRLA